MFWDNFLFYCNQKGVAPNVAAQSVGIKSSGTVTGWKNGAMPRPGVLSKLAQYFEISVSDLVGEEQKEKPALQMENGFDADTKELFDIWNSEDEAGRKALIEMARFLKSKREK